MYSPIPTAEITVRDPWIKHFYHHFAMSRSISADGEIHELDENPTGLRWGTKNAGPIYVNEFGYKTEFAPGSLPVWARAGFIYNTTDYSTFNGGQAEDNYAAYAGLTVQLAKNSTNLGGLNLDIKVDSAPSDRNIFYKNVAVNLFYVGLFESRPFDMAAIGYSKPGRVLSCKMLSLQAELAIRLDFPLKGLFHMPISLVQVSISSRPPL